MVKNNRVYDIQIKKMENKNRKSFVDDTWNRQAVGLVRRGVLDVNRLLPKAPVFLSGWPLAERTLPVCWRTLVTNLCQRNNGLTIPNIPTTTTGPSRRVPSTYCRLLRLYLIKKGNKNIWFFSMAHHIHVSKASQSRKGVTNEGGPFELFYIV